MKKKNENDLNFQMIKKEIAWDCPECETEQFLIGGGDLLHPLTAISGDEYKVRLECRVCHAVFLAKDDASEMVDDVFYTARRKNLKFFKKAVWEMFDHEENPLRLPWKFKKNIKDTDDCTGKKKVSGVVDCTGKRIIGFGGLITHRHCLSTDQAKELVRVVGGKKLGIKTKEKKND